MSQDGGNVEQPKTEPDVADLNRRIDDIVAFQKRAKPWYQDTGFIISGSAFVISVVTTMFSLYRTHQQDINNLKTQLRDTIQKSSLLVVQSVELNAKHRNDQQTILALSSALNSQNIGLAREAYTLTKSLGSNASSLDLIGAANALINSEEFSLAEELLKDAVARAARAIEYFAALRVLSAIQYRNGQRGEALASFKKAIAVFEKFPSEANNETFVNITQAYSHLYWAAAVMWSDCKLAKESLTAAQQHLAGVPPAMSHTMKSEVDRLTSSLAACP
jgi:tetratricopeptide (TPR) repeat protein